jgi:hypothetical protein
MPTTAKKMSLTGPNSPYVGLREMLMYAIHQHFKVSGHAPVFSVQHPEDRGESENFLCSNRHFDELAFHEVVVFVPDLSRVSLGADKVLAMAWSKSPSRESENTTVSRKRINLQARSVFVGKSRHPSSTSGAHILWRDEICNNPPAPF